jgi:hypothetical protein
MLDRWCGGTSRSRLPSFIRLLKTIRAKERRDPRLHQTWGIQREGRGTQHKSSLNHCQSHGLHSAKATLALECKLLGPIDLKLPMKMRVDPHECQ